MCMPHRLERGQKEEFWRKLDEVVESVPGGRDCKLVAEENIAKQHQMVVCRMTLDDD